MVKENVEKDIQQKQLIVDNTVQKLKTIAQKSIQASNYDKALDAISAAGNILYQWNQYYTDDELESDIVRVSEMLVTPAYKKSEAEPNTILFYDNFGLDVRGLIIIYLKALCELNYHVVYVTVARAQNNQPELHLAVEGHNIEWIYIHAKNKLQKLKELSDAFAKYKPNVAFFYTTPDDAAGAAVFHRYGGIVTRFQINLTDHAFWLGKCALDYCIEFRQYGASVSRKFRKISEDKLILLPYYPYHRDREFQGFPFDSNGHKILFSGGALYKTLGDPKNSYYMIVSELLKRHQDLIFVYAGNGDSNELDKLIAKYPGQAYHIAERSDLFQVMEHSDLYLSTYPVVGGLMLQYAATAGVVPLTLVNGADNNYNGDSSGILMHQETVEYDSIEKLIIEADRLLTDSEYHDKRAVEMKNAVISEDNFKNNLKVAIESHNSVLPIELYDIDTKWFRQQYLRRFCEKDIISAVAQPDQFSLFWDFPALFWKRAVGAFKKRLLK